MSFITQQVGQLVCGSVGRPAVGSQGSLAALLFSSLTG